jgi:hypothetical protein
LGNDSIHIIDAWVIFLTSIISNSYLYSKNSFFKRLQIVSNASGTNSGTMWFRLLQRVDLEQVRNMVPFPAGSQIGNHPTLRLLKINAERLFSLPANQKVTTKSKG